MPAHLYATPRMKYEAIREYSREYSVRKMFKALNLAEGTYYQWLRRKEAKERKRENTQRAYTIDTELVKRALSNALINTGGGGENTIFHSDRGMQTRNYRQHEIGL